MLISFFKKIYFTNKHINYYLEFNDLKQEKSSCTFLKTLCLFFSFIIFCSSFNFVWANEENTTNTKKAATFEDLLKKKQQKNTQNGETTTRQDNNTNTKAEIKEPTNKDGTLNLPNKLPSNNQSDGEQTKDDSKLNETKSKSDVENSLNSSDGTTSDHKPSINEASFNKIALTPLDWKLTFNEGLIRSRNFYALVVTPSKEITTENKIIEKIDNKSQAKENSELKVENTFNKTEDYHGTELIKKSENDLIGTGAFHRLFLVYVAYQHLKSRLSEDYEVLDREVIKPTEELGVLGFKAGTKWKIKDFLMASLITDAADSHTILADIISPDKNYFITEMNSYMKNMGLSNTKIKDLYGEDKGGSITTTKELALFLAEFLKIKDLKDWLETANTKIESVDKKHSFILANPYHELLKGSTFRGQEQISSGIASWNISTRYSLLTYTPLGKGYVIVSSARATDNYFRFLDHTSFYASGLNRTHEYTVFKKGEKIHEFMITGSLQKVLPVNITRDVVLRLPELVGKNQLQFSAIWEKDVLTAPLSKDTKLGKIELSFDNEILYAEEFSLLTEIERIPLYRFNSFLYALYLKNKPAFFLLQIFLLLLTVAIIVIYNYYQDLKAKKIKKNKS